MHPTLYLFIFGIIFGKKNENLNMFEIEILQAITLH